ncbi:MAG: efflux RND transporter permease subunit [Actinomycetota bacterium]|nr:efflux RND transporter permease subunit [Actinomycetota bacterium]
MMRWIVGMSIKFRFIVVAMVAGMMLYGVTQLRNTPLDVFPEFAPPQVEIQTISLGLNTTDVESLVTVPLEETLNGVPGLETIRSRSVADLSSIQLLFKPGTDLLEARQLVSERVRIVTPTLPTWAAPPVMMPPVSATRRVMHIGVTSESESLIDLSTTAYWKIRARLLRVPGVANVAIWGEQLQQQHVQVIPKRLRQLHVSLDDVMRAAADSLDAGLLKYSDGAVIGTGGAMQTPNQQLSIRHILPITSPEDLARVVVKERAGRTIVLGDVAELLVDHQPLGGDAVINNGPGLLLVVEKFPWGNTLEVTKGVEDALAEMQPGLPGVTFDTQVFRAGNFVEDAIHNLSHSLLVGVLLMMLVLLVFLYDWRSALISAITIPLSLTAAGLVLHVLGITINTMILAGFVIALGAVVDDAIVDCENIVRRMRIHRKVSDDRSVATTAKIVFDASLEVRGAVVYASMIEGLALLPIFFLRGLTGSFFRPLATGYALAVAVSTVVALISTPATAMILLRKGPLERRESPLVGWLQKGYDRMLAPIIRSPKPAYVTVGAIMVAGALALPLLGQSLLPTFQERDFLMHWISAPGTSVGEERRIVTQASRELTAIPGVRSFGSHIGQAFLSEEISGVNFGENWISIDPEAPFDETVAAIDEVIEGFPGLFRNRETYLNERIDEVLAGSSDAIVVRIFGDDLETLRSKADEVGDLLGEIDGVVDQHVELQADIPQIQIEVDLARAERYGLKPGDVRRAAATMLASEEIGDIFRDGKAYDVHVFSTPAGRDSVDDVSSMQLDTPDGEYVELKDVADISLVPNPNAIMRESFSRTITVGANVEDRDLGSVVGELQEQLSSVEFPLGVHAEVLGEFTERQAAQSRLLGFSLVAVLGIFLILIASFGSVRLATLAFVTLPMALVGGVLAAYFGGRIISIGSLVGFFTVLGIVARNGIMMVSHYEHLEEHEGMTFGPELVARGSRERLAPIVMTALTTGLALIPLVLAGNLPGEEIEYPMGIVILGGLITTTLLNLFVLPSLYLRFGKSRRTYKGDVARVPPMPA